MSNVIDDNYIVDYINNHNLAIASTVDEGGLPHAAPIYYVIDGDYNFYFVTPIKTQKSKNLKANSEIVLTITNEESKETVQVRGSAKPNEKILSDILPKLAQKLNHEKGLMLDLPLLNYKNQKKIVMVVTPEKIRFRRYSKEGFEEKFLLGE